MLSLVTSYNTAVVHLPWETNHFCHLQVPSNPYAALARSVKGPTDEIALSVGPSAPDSSPPVCTVTCLVIRFEGFRLNSSNRRFSFSLPWSLFHTANC